MSLTLVTGGGRGIGAATALRLAAAGHDLVLGYRPGPVRRRGDGGAGARARRRLRHRGRRRHRPGPGGRVVRRGRRPRAADRLVNNAGATLHLGDLADTPVDVIRQVVDLNLTAALLVARRAVRDLTAGGALVNVSSAAATLGAPHEYVHYAAAKAGVDALTQGLAQEVAPRGIRVIGVAPGIVRTEIHADAGDPGRLDRVAPTVPLGRVGEPEEVAEAIAWLLSDACPYATGATLRVAGGR